MARSRAVACSGLGPTRPNCPLMRSRTWGPEVPPHLQCDVIWGYISCPDKGGKATVARNFGPRSSGPASMPCLPSCLIYMRTYASLSASPSLTGGPLRRHTGRANVCYETPATRHNGQRWGRRLEDAVRGPPLAFRKPGPSPYPSPAPHRAFRHQDRRRVTPDVVAASATAVATASTTRRLNALGMM